MSDQDEGWDEFWFKKDLEQVDGYTCQIIEAFIFSMKQQKNSFVPERIINQIILFYFQNVCMDPKTKYFRVHDDMKTATSLSKPRDWTDHSIKCDNWVSVLHGNWIHQWNFWIKNIPNGMNWLEFAVCIKGEEEAIKRLRWCPAHSDEHRIKYFKTNDEVTVEICFQMPNYCNANLTVNNWRDGPDYDLKDLYLDIDPYTEFTICWLTERSNCIIKLINFRSWKPGWLDKPITDESSN